MRAILRPLAKLAAFNPIETIVCGFVLMTLAYFHVLSAIKYSAYASSSGISTIRPSHVFFRSGEWFNVGEDMWFVKDAVERVELQPVGLKSKTGVVDVYNASLALTSSIASSCYRAPDCFSHVSDNTVTLAFTPFLGGREAFVSSRTVADSYQSSRWIAYALRSVTLRFYDLASNADSLDIILILAGYLLMHMTFFRLLRSSRALGSNFWLTAAVLSSAVLSFTLSLPIALHLGIPVDPVLLTESLPFLVCTIGFDKPLRLARAVFTHEHMYGSIDGRRGGQFKPASNLILEALDNVGNIILRDYALEVFVLSVGASSKVGGLKECCALAALILTVDGVVLGTFYIATLGVMVEVKRIKALRASAIASASRPTSRLASPILKPKALPATAPYVPAPSSPLREDATLDTSRLGGLKRRFWNGILGSKGPAVQSQKDKTVDINPLTRLKLLLIVSFVTLHLLNLCTTLTPSATSVFIKNDVKFGVDGTGIRKVDVRTPDIQGALQGLINMQDSNDTSSLEVLVRVNSPIQVFAPDAKPSRASPQRTSGLISGRLDSFMSSWTSLVGDPVVSKWIVVCLAASLALNACLINGMALGGLGMGGIGGIVGVRFAAGTKEKARGGVRMEVDPPVTIIGEHKEETEERPGLHQRRAAKFEPQYLAPAPFTPSPPSVAPALKIVTKLEKHSTLDGLALDLVDKKLEESRSRLILTPQDTRSLEQCMHIFENGPRPVSVSLAMLTDEEVIILCQAGKIQAYALEKMLGSDNLERAVAIRRALISRDSRTKTLEHSDIPMRDYAYERVLGACCENVVGYIPIPLGIAGPLNVDGVLYPIPMATAEGTLVASTSRGCKALNAGGGVTTVLTRDAMTRGPAIDFPSIIMAAKAKEWIESPDGAETIREAFESTSRFAKLHSLKCTMAGRTMFVRFATATGDAMGMNMISKGTEKGLEVLRERFPEMTVLALSGNYCTDKKPAAINWIEGRGKSVVAEAIVPGHVVKTVLKTTVADLCNLNIKKNLIGSAMAGSVGGFNAHAANILTAMFLAAGQDPAQNVESSNCMTLIEPTNNGQDIRMSVTMPSIEVGTVGGGTVLAPQQAVLDMLGVRGAHPTHPGRNAQQLARVIAAAVMAGELSLLSALAAGHLVKAHLQHNRSAPPTPASSRPVTPAPFEREEREERVITNYSGVHTPASTKSRALSRSSSMASLPAYSEEPKP